MVLGEREVIYADIKLTKHARRRMVERGISLEDIIEALTRTCEDVHDKQNDVYIALGCNGIAVVYSYRPPVMEIITVLREKEYNALIGRLGKRRYKVLRSFTEG